MRFGRYVPLLAVHLATTFQPARALLSAQEASANRPSATVVERVNVNIVNIDVHVTNRRGEPVADLELSDFEIHEQGIPVEVTNFLSAAKRDEREWAEADVPEVTEGPAPPLLVALYIDRIRTSHGNLLRIGADLAAFLSKRGEQAAPARFLLATGDPELNIRTPFSSDPRELLGALAELQEEPRSPMYDDDSYRLQVLREIRHGYETCAQPSSNSFGVGCVPCVDLWPSFLGSASQYAAELRSRAGASLSALAELMTALGGLPGPKALIYVGEGLPQRPGADLYHYLGELCSDRQAETNSLERSWDDTTRLNRLAALSNAHRVTIYPVDAGGVRSASAVDASLAGPVGAFEGGRGGDQRLANVLVPSNQNDRLRVDNLQAAFSLLASETGGRAVFNQARPAQALEDIALDFGSYYSLGYAAPPESRYSIRQIDVRLTRPRKGWRVRYRRSYLFKTEEQRLADRLFAALKLNEQSNPLGASLRFADSTLLNGSAEVTLPVEVQLSASAVTLLDGPQGKLGAVRLFLIAENADGRRTPMRQKLLAVTPAESQLEVGINIDLPPGVYSVAVGIRDEATGRTSYLVDDVDVTSPEA